MGFFYISGIHKASTQCSLAAFYPETNQNCFLLSSGASSQVACTGGSRMDSGIPQLESTACPKKMLSPPERLCRHCGFEVGATADACCCWAGSHTLRTCSRLVFYLFWCMLIQDRHWQWPMEGTDVGEDLRARSRGSGQRVFLPGVNRVTVRCGRVLLLNLKPGYIR